MYGMIDESVNIVRNSHLQVSVSSGLSASISSGKGKISNLDDVLEQLLESFKDKGKYIWGLEIY